MFSHVRGVSDGYDLCSHTSPEASERTRGLLSLGRHSHQWRLLLSIIWLSSSVSLPVPASSFYPLFGGVLESAVVWTCLFLLPGGRFRCASLAALGHTRLGSLRQSTLSPLRPSQALAIFFALELILADNTSRVSFD